MVESMTYQEYDKEINACRWNAKRKLKINDEVLAKMCGKSASLIRCRASDKELPMLPFWVVAQIAKASGKEIVFVERNTK